MERKGKEPRPGLELKLVPNGSKLEMRVRGVSVFAGYRNAPRETAAAFDHEGFYRIGDAGYLVDAERPDKGVVFNGRVAEDFKLSSGSWVSTKASARLSVPTKSSRFTWNSRSRMEVSSTSHGRICCSTILKRACSKSMA